MQSVQLERENGNLKAAWDLCEISIQKFPDFYKLWLISAQIKEQLGDNNSAIKIYEKGIETLKRCPELYICLSRLYFSQGLETKSRSVIEKARSNIPSNPLVWEEAIKLEIKCDNIKGANLLISKALQECPENGKLWSLAIDLEPKYQKKARAMDALNKCDHDPYVMMAIAK